VGIHRHADSMALSQAFFFTKSGKEAENMNLYIYTREIRRKPSNC
jgi:hypothetical protein